jgi:hypothetical protein
MNDLIKALQIFAKYMPNNKYPTWCRHDELHVCCDPREVSKEDMLELNELGFITTDCDGEPEFVSFRYGSC